MGSDDKQPKDEAKGEAHVHLVGGHGGSGQPAKGRTNKRAGGLEGLQAM